MYQLISKEWGFENGRPVRLEHYVADSREDALPDAPVGSDCLFPDGARAVRFGGGWVILEGSGSAASDTSVGSAETEQIAYIEEELADLRAKTEELEAAIAAIG
ncbi:MAG: hypothetical protein IJY89_04675 [Clostridia bacterium]|nr:hypothetical protein [Clostridia bacterium]